MSLVKDILYSSKRASEEGDDAETKELADLHLRALAGIEELEQKREQAKRHRTR